VVGGPGYVVSCETSCSMVLSKALKSASKPIVVGPASRPRATEGILGRRASLFDVAVDDGTPRGAETDCHAVAYCLEQFLEAGAMNASRISADHSSSPTTAVCRIILRQHACSSFGRRFLASNVNSK
jgi:hypothetical protein